jgi:alkylhydroperoxidase family enzyme
MPDRPLRLAPLSPDQWTPEVRDFFGAVYGPKGREEGTTFNMPLTFARHPALTQAIFAFSKAVQEASGLSKELREIVIARVAWLYQTGYEWGHHHRYLRDLGMGDAHIAGIKQGPDAAVWSDLERAVLRAVDETILTREMTEATWQALASRLSEKQILDVLVLAGQYIMLAGVFNAVGLRLEPAYDQYALENS